MSEHDGALWICAADGFRLHAHQVEGIPVGVYCLVGNQLRAVNDRFPTWQNLIPPALRTVTMEDYLPIDSYGTTAAGWTLDGDVLRKPTASDACNYWLNETYLSDAWTLGNEEPAYQIEVVKKSWYKAKMLLRWPQAMAMIMPMNLNNL